jgi:predicted esterase
MLPGSAEADTAAPATTAAPSWCFSGVETLPNDVCYLDGRTKAPRRTLVIWLHGVVARNTTMSWNHERMLLRVAKATGVEMLFPKGVEDGSLYAWPGKLDSQEQKEGALIEQWMNAKAILEKRENKSFDEVFVMGFSSGAYFASSLAMRGRAEVDGYAVFAGGQPMPARTSPVTRFAPVFVGVCADDSQTAQHSRAFAGSLAAAGIRRMVNEQKVGHDLSAAHFLNALAFLRSQVKARPVTA